MHYASPPNRRQALGYLRRDLFGGVTAVRDMAGDTRALGELAREARMGEIPVARHLLRRADGGAGVLYRPAGGNRHARRDARPGRVDARDHARHRSALAVANAHGTGATAIKIYADLGPELVHDITAEAHRQGMLVWAHAAVFPASPPR